MSGVNKVIIIGHLGADPEKKTIGNGQTVTRLNVATSEAWTDKTGQKQERTEWHRISVWGRQAEACATHLNKGRQVYVEGRLQTRSWEDPNGQKRYATEIIATTVQFLGSGSNKSNNQQIPGQETQVFNDFGPEPQFNADEIPF